MVSLTRSNALMDLGKRLVSQLEAGDDLLSSWMAHYIAERIEAAEKASGEDREAAQDVCAKAILDLWQHRNTLPDHLRPLGELEPIVRAIASLDVDQSDYRNYPHALREAATAHTDEETKQWLELAFGLDYSVRVLISFALAFAAQRAVSDTAPWVDLARQAGADLGPEAYVIKWVSGPNELAEPEEDQEAEKLRERLSRLEAFADLLATFTKDLRTQLGSGEADEG